MVEKSLIVLMVHHGENWPREQGQLIDPTVGLFICPWMDVDVSGLWPVINKAAVNISVHICEDIRFHFSWVDT